MSQSTFEFIIPKNFPKRASECKLSPKETQIVRLLLQNEKQESIAQALKISPHTVNNHLRRIYAKLGIHDRVTVTLFFLQTSQTR
jgi:DNA-binding CsgD family transcriptional regulator